MVLFSRTLLSTVPVSPVLLVQHANSGKMLVQVQFYLSLVVLLPAALSLPVAVDYNQCPFLVAAPGVGWYCCEGYTVSVEHGEVVGYRPYVSGRCLDIAGEITYATTSAPTGWVGSSAQAYLIFGCAGGLLLVALCVVVASRYDVSVHAPVPTNSDEPLGDLMVSEPNDYEDISYERAPEVCPAAELYMPLTGFPSHSPTASPPSPRSTYGFANEVVTRL